MTRATVRIVGVLLGAAALDFAPADARQPRVEPVASVVVTRDKTERPWSAGLAFLPDGARVAVRWEQRPEVPADAQLVVVGPRGEKSAPIALMPVATRPELSGCGVVLTRAGEIVTLGVRKQAEVPPAGPPTPLPPLRRVEVTDADGPSHYPTQVWLAGPAEGVFVLRRGPRTAYQLVAVEGAPPAGGKGRLKVLAEGGTKNEQAPASDLHSSGRWFAAAVGSADILGGERLDLWELGPVPKKQSVPLKVNATAVSFAPDGKTVALGLSDGTVAFRATSDLAERREPVEVGRFTVAALAHHPRGPYLACGTLDPAGAANLVVLRTDTGAVVRRIPADAHAVLAVCFNATGTRVATFGGSGRVAVWDTSDLAGPVE